MATFFQLLTTMKRQKQYTYFLGILIAFAIWMCFSGSQNDSKLSEAERLSAFVPNGPRKYLQFSSATVKKPDLPFNDGNKVLYQMRKSFQEIDKFQNLTHYADFDVHVPLKFDQSSVKKVDIALIQDIPRIHETKIDSSKPASEDIHEDTLTAATGLTFYNRQFYLNGKPFQIFSGAIHYFRVLPQYWEDRLKKLKACGLNTVETYVAWNLHEPSPGVYHFDGRLDLRRFIKLAEELGLYVIFRPGPYICSEWDFGGMPGWLLADPEMQVRSNYPGYVSAVNRYFSVLLPLVKDLQFTEGGPIIMVQVENEYGVYGRDIEHLKFLTYLYKREGIVEFLVTSDNGDNHIDFHEYALPTENFHQPKRFEKIRAMNLHFPLMVQEFWTGWFDNWGQNHHSQRGVVDVNNSLQQLLAMNASINFYMFLGGTNFGFTAGGINSSHHLSFVTSYDYDALLSEAGDITDKYTACRDTMVDYYKKLGVPGLPEVPPNTPKANYGSIEMKEIMTWSDLMNLKPIGIRGAEIHHMEKYTDSDDLHSTLGYIVYSKTVLLDDLLKMGNLSAMTESFMVHDRLLSILEGELFHIMHGPLELVKAPGRDWNKMLSATITSLKAEGKTSGRLDLVVESLGRCGYSNPTRNLFNQQRKGLYGFPYPHLPITGQDWDVSFLPFDHSLNSLISKASAHASSGDLPGWRPLTEPYRQRSPALVRGYLEVKDSNPADTFIDPFVDQNGSFGKGVILVNGFNIGRYWHVSPQRTLYIPGPLLKTGTNEIIFFEEEHIGRSSECRAEHDIGKK